MPRDARTLRLAVLLLLPAVGAGCDRGTAPPVLDAPDVEIVAAPPAVSRDTAVEVAVRARHAERVVRLTYSVGGGAAVEVPITPGPEVSATVRPSGLAAGENVVTITAYDAAGNRGTAEVRVVVDLRDVAVHVPSRDTTITGREVRMEGSSRGGNWVYLDVVGPTGQVYQRGGFNTRQDTAVTRFGTEVTRLVQGRNVIRLSLLTPDARPTTTDSVVVMVDVPVLRYTVTPLRDPRGGRSVATALNAHGVVVGYNEYTDGSLRAFRWEAGEMRELQAGSGDARTLGINDRGQIVGEYLRGPNSSAAFLWENGAVRDSLLPDGLHRMEAVDVNERGQVLVNVGRVPNTGLVWEDGRTHVPWAAAMAARGVDHFSRLTRINDAGQMIADGWFWDGERLRNVLPLGQIADLNDRGEIVYSYRLAGSDPEPGATVPNHNLLEVTPPSSVPLAIDDQSRILGRHPAGAGGRFFLWSAGVAREIVLDDSNWVIPFPTRVQPVDPVPPALNARGQFLAHGTHRVTGETTALLFTPVTQ